eukprot:932566-Prorocentrum_minimum.AAC.2
MAGRERRSGGEPATAPAKATAAHRRSHRFHAQSARTCACGCYRHWGGCYRHWDGCYRHWGIGLDVIGIEVDVIIGIIGADVIGIIGADVIGIIGADATGPHLSSGGDEGEVGVQHKGEPRGAHRQKSVHRLWPARLARPREGQHHLKAYGVRKESAGELKFRVIRWLDKVLPVNSTASVKNLWES